MKWIIYISGFFGLFLFNNVLLTMLFYRYDPGISNSNNFPLIVPSLLVGIALFISRSSAAILQPFIGYSSDRFKSRWGCRRPFLAISIFPLTFSFILLFLPPKFSEIGNFFYLLILLFLFFCSLALYQIPYLAWLPTIAPTDKQRIFVATLLGVSSLLGTAVAGIGSPWLTYHYNFEVMAFCLGSLGLITLLIPLINLENETEPIEKRYSFRQSFQLGWKNLPFRIYLGGIGSAWITASILSVCPTYIAVALLQKQIDFGGIINGIFLLSALLGTALITLIVRRWGKAKTFQISMFWSAGILLILGLFSLWFKVPQLIWLMLLMLNGLGLASIFILPNAMLPDIIDNNKKFKKNLQAVYFGIRGLLIEISVGFGLFLAGILLMLGNTKAQPQGILFSLIIAACFAFVSAGFFSFYRIQK
ncbi:MFS transporter [Gloeothece verrucosa]|uniref:Major facilitator superfamily MFS_1 n=1 Tax=Gloeothece verrucosa (strain PCC 7822) TaxID=497965 RepID=E0UL75_GLOV7|nr:MFS transporter [Gloeothece verrucosa]ADN17705.1 major facilitator superfamily MFS_1 [Gloeothece verrucosa PCC 7822]